MQPKKPKFHEFVRRNFGFLTLVDEEMVCSFEKTAEQLMSETITPFEALFLYSNIIAIIESALRDCVREYINGLIGKSIILPASLKNSRLDIKDYIGLKERHYTIGDMVSHSFNVSNTEVAEELLDFCFPHYKIKDVFDNPKFQSCNRKYSDLFENEYVKFHIAVSNSFVIRHEYIHELSRSMFLTLSMNQQKNKEELIWNIRSSILFVKIIIFMQKMQFYNNENEEDLDIPFYIKDYKYLSAELDKKKKKIDEILTDESSRIRIRHLFSSIEEYVNSAGSLVYHAFAGTMQSGMSYETMNKTIISINESLDKIIATIENLWK